MVTCSQNENAHIHRGPKPAKIKIVSAIKINLLWYLPYIVLHIHNGL